MTLRKAEERYQTRLAVTGADVAAALRLRYRVFVQELGADGPGVDHASCTEQDEFDPLFDHLILVDTRCDPARLDHVVGVYRLLPSDRLPPGGRFYSEAEFDLTVLKASGRRLLELGRSCIHPDHRGGTGLMHLWNALAGYVLDNQVEILFGAASFPGTDLARLSAPLALLAQMHLAPEHLRVRATGAGAAAFPALGADRIDRRAALADMPALIKAYLRLGGMVGDGVFLDHAFRTTDVCLVLDTRQITEQHRNFYIRKGQRK